jgi:amino acid adenylation domain-containing protein
MSESNTEGIAIIGMTGRFPGAGNVNEFWRNLVDGKESISTFTEEELAAAGLDVEEIKKTPNYVPSRGILKDAEWFDAHFFGMNRKETEVTDPQQRLFLEAAWEALEDAGYDPERFKGPIGVYAGMGNGTYFINNLLSRQDLINSVGPMVAMMGNEKDFLATRVAFKLNLKGPAISVNTACSTSLVAVCQAFQSLLSYQCDMALAGGVSVTFPQKRGFHFQEGGIVSPDGHCRAFDAQSQGTVSSDGLGIVVLKRLADALNDGDRIYAVIKGTGLNNDGAAKGSFTAPSVDGQAEAIAQAQAFAGFDPATIGYVEAHGTGTPLGDPIEVAGLTQAFRAGTDRKNFCAIGSVKSNIGHLDTAAGVAGLIKTALALHHKQLPPSLHYTQPNPRIDFENSPFHVNTKVSEWKSGATPRRAGVSSFGLGGTNAHVVLEEAPVASPSPASREWQLIVLSAKTDSALNAASAGLAGHLKTNLDLNLPDAAFTLQTGRAVFNHRRIVVCHDAGDAANALESSDPKRVFTQSTDVKDAPVVFMFPGQGAQHINMGVALYRTEPVFKEEVDRCAKLLQPQLGLDLREIIFPQAGTETIAEEKLVQTRFTQPALFVVEYALARLWMSWGIKPAAMIGHSVGEYVAACLAGVFTLPDALALVANRARLVQAQPGGAMLAVRLPEKDLLPMLGDRLSIAAINSPSLCVVSGPFEAVAEFEGRLKEKGIAGKRLSTSHAFHSAMMDPVIEPFTQLLHKIKLNEPTIPYISNVTARWITANETVDPNYWAGHVRQAVRFADGVAELLKNPQSILLEVGPGQTLSNLSRQHPAKSGGQTIVASLSGSKDQAQDTPAMLTALGKLWLAGAPVDWAGFYQRETRRRVALPTYPFERQRYWAEPGVPLPKARAVPNSETDVEVSQDVTAEPKVALTRKERIFKDLAAQLLELSGAGMPELATSTTFAELGLDSLFLAQLSQNIQKKFGLKVTFRQLAEQLTTPNALSEYLDQQLPAETAPAPSNSASQEVAPETQKARVETLPLTEGQMELWLGTQWGGDASRAMNHSFAIHLHGPMNVEALRETIQQLVDRHDALRITFAQDGTSQSVRPTLAMDVPLLDFSRLGDEERKKKLADAEKMAGDRAFELLNGPLFRAEVVKLTPTHHVLLLASHHLIMDGWSLGVMFHEISAIYSAKVKRTDAVIETAMQFSDYVWSGKSPDNITAAQKAEAFWLAQFVKPPASVELPTDRPRPPVKTYRGASTSLPLGSACHQALKQACAREGCTLFVYLFASYNVWLHRLGGQTDLVVGVPAAGQIAAGAEEQRGNKSLVGHCVNLLPIRTQCEGGHSFRDYLKAVKGIVLDAYENQQFTFANLLSKLNLPRDTGRMPLVSTTFNVNRATNGFHLDGLETEIISLPKAFNIFDITVDVIDSDKDFSIECRFNTDLFDTTTMNRWMGHWKTLLEATLANPDQVIATIPILNEMDRKQLLVDWNDTKMEFPQNQCVQQLVEAQAERAPDVVALRFEREQMTYRQLNQKANRLAHYLRAQGVGPDTLVGLCVERSLEMVVGLLGILKAGGAYVPLDPKYPKDRIAFILEDANAAVLLTQQSLLSELPKVVGSNNSTIRNPKIICLDSNLSAVPSKDETNPVCTTTPDHLAYVLYTSGSTGRPKGVQISHRALVNFLTSTRREPGLDASDVLLAVTTLSFDIAGLELWLPLTTGARVVIAKAETAMDGKLLARQMAECGATIMQATPVTWRLLLGTGWQANPGLKILCGGEAWPEDLVRQLLPKCASLWNMYGPTETTIWSAVDRVERPGTPVIGRPMGNTQFHVLDSHLQPVPIGVPGELHIGGDGLARGYLNREELTREKFIKNPFSSEPQARLYKTGDLVRYRADGKIEFLSRIDNQVKIRGHRIELGEIETALRQHPNVRDCAVAAKDGTAGEKRLVGYAVARQSPSPGAGELRGFLKERLPNHAIPSALIILENLPLTPNGKVDRKALPEPGEQPEPEPSTPPSTPTQIALARIWCEVLKVTQIGIHDNFFELGGDSLTAMQLVSRLGSLLGLEMTMVDVFNSPTVATMSEWLEQLV